MGGPRVEHTSGTGSGSAADKARRGVCTILEKGLGAPRGAVHRHGEADAALNDANFVCVDLHKPMLCGDVKRALLRHCERAVGGWGGRDERC
jgi:hypothetical protein